MACPECGHERFHLWTIQDLLENKHMACSTCNKDWDDSDRVEEKESKNPKPRGKRVQQT